MLRLRSARLNVTASAVGYTTITVQNGAATASAGISVQPVAVLAGVNLESQLQWGAVTEVSFSTNPAPITDITMTVALSDPTVLEVLTPPELQAGTAYGTFLVRAKNKTGSTQLTLGYQGSYAEASVSTQQLPNISVSANNPSTGHFDNLNIGADCTLADGIVFSITSSNPSVVSVHPSVLVLSPNDQVSGVQLFGVTGGTGLITVSAPSGSTASITAPVVVTVTP